jgi:hypothetical protein
MSLEARYKSNSLLDIHMSTFYNQQPLETR